MKGVLKGTFAPKNKEKYVGKYPIWYRSTWELSVMRMCDNNPNILEWASEAIKIPYTNPLTNKHTVYVPDFLVIFEDKTGTRKMEVWEVKPKKEALIEFAVRDKDKLAFVVNQAKWKAAVAWCSANGAAFRIITEDMIFHNHKGR